MTAPDDPRLDALLREVHAAGEVPDEGFSARTAARLAEPPAPARDPLPWLVGGAGLLGALLAWLLAPALPAFDAALAGQGGAMLPILALALAIAVGGVLAAAAED